MSFTFADAGVNGSLRASNTTAERSLRTPPLPASSQTVSCSVECSRLQISVGPAVCCRRQRNDVSCSLRTENGSPWGQSEGPTKLSSESSASPFGLSSFSVPSSTLSAGKQLIDWMRRPILKDLKQDEKAADLASDPVFSKGGLVDGGLVYREKFMIRCYEVGVNRTATIDTIANLLQEVACNHARSVGFSNDGFAITPAMRRNGLIWVTTKLHIEMDKYPEWGDIVEVDTWFQRESNIMSRRDWVVKLSSTGEKIGAMTSDWVMMNQETRRLSRMPEDVMIEFDGFCPDPPRYALPPSEPGKLPRFEEPAEFARLNLMPRRSDLDMNHHVNNVTYVSWMLESLPEEIMSVAELVKLTLEYRRECGQDDVVESLAKLSVHEDECLHKSMNGALTSQNGSLARWNDSLTSQKGSNQAQTGQLTLNHKSRVEFVHLLRRQSATSEGYEEINKGRTVWRCKNNMI